MAPKTQRSKACAECRERRVKCDMTPEVCNHCHRLGKRCSGPVVGTIFNDMTPRVGRPSHEKKARIGESARKGDHQSTSNLKIAPKPRDASKRPVATPLVTGQQPTRASPTNHAPLRPEPPNQPPSLIMPLPNSTLPVERRYTKDVERTMAAIRYMYRPPTFHQPTRVLSDALDAAFLAHYVERHNDSGTCSPESQWLVHGTLRNPIRPAIKLSLRAVSMAFYGKSHRDPTILMDSWHWYSVGLNAQRVSIARLRRGFIPEEEDIILPLILAMYEIHVDETPDCYSTNLAAAAEMMTMRGPNNCKSAAIWPLFNGIRKSDAQRAIVFNKPSVYSSQKWMTIPFVDTPRDALQHLADIELRIPGCMALLKIRGTLRRFFETPIPTDVNVEPCCELTGKLINDLDNWAAKYPTLAKVSWRKSNADGSEHGVPAIDQYEIGPGQPDPYQTSMASNYAAIRLILSMLMHKMSTQSKSLPVSLRSVDYQFLSEAIQYAQAVLHSIVEVEKSQTPHFDLLQNIFPLVSVACTTPVPGLGNKAGEVMQRWATKIARSTVLWQQTSNKDSPETTSTPDSSSQSQDEAELHRKG